METPANTAEVIISKHRNGSLGTVTLEFIKENVKFVDYQFADFRNMPGMGSDIFSDNTGGTFITRPSAINIDGDDDIFEDS